MRTRLLAVASLLAALVMAALSSSTAAVAAPYPPANPPSLSASAYDPCAGASNVLGGNGYQAGETVSIVLTKTGEIARVVVGADGSWRTTVTIPLSERGSDEVVVTGVTSGLVATTRLEFPCVVGESAGQQVIGSGNLASTGAVVGGVLLLGLVLLGVGTTLVVAGRRRRVRVG